MLVGTLEVKAAYLLFQRASTGSSAFRRWYYPGLPKDYTVNPRVELMIHRGVLQGKSAREIAEGIYERYG